jgi:hypothetical protein
VDPGGHPVQRPHPVATLEHRLRPTTLDPLDPAVREQLGHTVEIAAVDPVGVGVEQVHDLAGAVHGSGA